MEMREMGEQRVGGRGEVEGKRDVKQKGQGGGMSKKGIRREQGKSY